MNRADRPGREATKRQCDVWALIARGWEDEQIAKHLGVSYHTARTHRDALYVRIGARNRVEAALLFHGIALNG